VNQPFFSCQFLSVLVDLVWCRFRVF